MKLLRGILNDFFYFLMCHTNVDYRNIQFFIPTTKSDQVIGKLVNRAPENMYTTGALIGAPLILQKTSTKIPLAPMGVLAPVSAHAGSSAQPPSALAEIFCQACLQSRFHKISPFSSQNRLNWGYRGDPPNIFFIGFLIFLILRSPCKIPKL